MRIVVLTKPVPDPASAGERLGPDGRLDRAAVPAVINGNDEYALEAALKLIEAAGEGEVTLLSMAPANAPETMRKALAMGATRGVLVTDPALEGSCAVSTTDVLAAALETLEFDLVLAGVDTSDGVAGVVPAGVAALNGLPYLSYAAKIEPDMAAGTVRVRRITPTGYDVLEAPMPALISGTQALGEPRYPSLKGIMAARSKEIPTLSLADLGLDASTVGGAVATTKVVGSRAAEARAATRVVREAPDEAARQIVAFLAERRLDLMGARARRRRGGAGRHADQALDRGRDAGAERSRRRPASTVTGVVHGADRGGRRDGAGALRAHGPGRRTGRRTAQPPATIAAALSTMVDAGDVVLLPASPNGRDVAGTLCGLAGMAVLANAVGARWSDDGPVVEMSAFGGKLITESAFTATGGVITVRPNAVTAEPLADARVRSRTVAGVRRPGDGRGPGRRARRGGDGGRLHRRRADHRRRRSGRRRTRGLQARRGPRRGARRGGRGDARRGRFRAGSRTASRSARRARS